MVIAATVGPPMVVVAGLRRAAPTEPATPAPPSEASWARRFGVSETADAARLQPTSARAIGVCAWIVSRFRCRPRPASLRRPAVEAAVAERRPVERADLAVQQELRRAEAERRAELEGVARHAAREQQARAARQQVDDRVAVGREVEPARPRAAEDAARGAGEDHGDQLGEPLQLAQVRPALARARAIGPAAEEVGARAHEVVAVVAVGPQPDAERVVRDDRPGRAERERRAEAPGLHAHEVDRQRAAERARQPRAEAAAADGHALGRDPPPVGADQPEAVAVGPHGRHARAERRAARRAARRRARSRRRRRAARTRRCVGS